MRSLSEVCTLFNVKHPENHISQTTISQIFHKFEEYGTLKDLPGVADHMFKTLIKN